MNARLGASKFRADGYEALLTAWGQLRLRLLELTGRNRLLNFRHTTGRSLRFIEGQPGPIYERLVERGDAYRDHYRWLARADPEGLDRA